MATELKITADLSSLINQLQQVSEALEKIQNVAKGIQIPFTTSPPQAGSPPGIIPPPQQTGMSYPGMSYPGMGYSGMGYPGIGYPGMGYPGMGYPGMGYPGMGYPGMSYPGMGYPGSILQPGSPEFNNSWQQYQNRGNFSSSPNNIIPGGNTTGALPTNISTLTINATQVIIYGQMVSLAGTAGGGGIGLAGRGVMGVPSNENLGAQGEINTSIPGTNVPISVASQKATQIWQASQRVRSGFFTSILTGEGISQQPSTLWTPSQLTPGIILPGQPSGKWSLSQPGGIWVPAPFLPGEQPEHPSTTAIKQAAQQKKAAAVKEPAAPYFPQVEGGVAPSQPPSPPISVVPQVSEEELKARLAEAARRPPYRMSKEAFMGRMIFGMSSGIGVGPLMMAGMRNPGAFNMSSEDFYQITTASIAAYALAQQTAQLTAPYFALQAQYQGTTYVTPEMKEATQIGILPPIGAAAGAVGGGALAMGLAGLVSIFAPELAIPATAIGVFGGVYGMNEGNSLAQQLVNVKRQELLTGQLIHYSMAASFAARGYNLPASPSRAFAAVEPNLATESTAQRNIAFSAYKDLADMFPIGSPILSKLGKTFSWMKNLIPALGNLTPAISGTLIKGMIATPGLSQEYTKWLSAEYNPSNIKDIATTFASLGLSSETEAALSVANVGKGGLTPNESKAIQMLIGAQNIPPSEEGLTQKDTKSIQKLLVTMTQLQLPGQEFAPLVATMAQYGQTYTSIGWGEKGSQYTQASIGYLEPMKSALITQIHIMNSNIASAKDIGAKNADIIARNNLLKELASVSSLIMQSKVEAVTQYWSQPQAQAQAQAQIGLAHVGAMLTAGELYNPSMGGAFGQAISGQEAEIRVTKGLLQGYEAAGAGPLKTAPLKATIAKLEQQVITTIMGNISEYFRSALAIPQTQFAVTQYQTQMYQQTGALFGSQWAATFQTQRESMNQIIERSKARYEYYLNTLGPNNQITLQRYQQWQAAKAMMPGMLIGQVEQAYQPELTVLGAEAQIAGSYTSRQLAYGMPNVSILPGALAAHQITQEQITATQSYFQMEKEAGAMPAKLKQIEAQKQAYEAISQQQEVSMANEPIPLSLQSQISQTQYQTDILSQVPGAYGNLRAAYQNQLSNLNKQAAYLIHRRSQLTSPQAQYNIDQQLRIIGRQQNTVFQQLSRGWQSRLISMALGTPGTFTLAASQFAVSDAVRAGIFNPQFGATARELPFFLRYAGLSGNMLGSTGTPEAFNATAMAGVNPNMSSGLPEGYPMASFPGGPWIKGAGELPLSVNLNVNLTLPDGTTLQGKAVAGNVNKDHIHSANAGQNPSFSDIIVKLGGFQK